MRCYNCRVELPENAFFCYKCGSPQKFTSLIQKALEKDQEATAQLYNMTYNNVYQTICMTASLDNDTVFDLIQNTYIKAFSNLPQLNEPEAFRGWVKTIARNLTIDQLRKKKVIVFSHMVSVDSDEMIEFEDEKIEHLPDVVMDKNETARLIGEILDSLSEEQRIAVTMHYFEELSVKEIADILEVSEGTVKSRLNYGRKKIEIGVRELEKKGTKLYGLAPIPFLLFLFKGQEAYAAEIPSAMLLQTIQNSLTASTAGLSMSAGASTVLSKKTAGVVGKETAKAAAKAVGTEAVKTSVGAAGKAAIVKAVAGVATVAVVGAGAVGITSLKNKESDIGQETETYEVVSAVSETEDSIGDYSIDQYVSTYREEHINYTTSFTYNGITSEEKYDLYFRIPEILIDSEDARQCNYEIQESFGQELDWACEAQRNNYDCSLETLDYEAWFYEDMMIVLISSSTVWNNTRYEAYVFDMASGERLSNSVIAEKYGLMDNYRENIRQSLDQAFLEMYSDPKLYYVHEPTISDENVDQSVLYIDENGDLMMVCTIYIPAGSGREEFLVPVSY